MTPKFPLGKTCATPPALEAMAAHGINPSDLIRRHVSGDWGCVGEEDRQTNDANVIHDERLLPAYPIDASKPCEGFGSNTLWVITERDRSVTTILLPSDY